MGARPQGLSACGESSGPCTPLSCTLQGFGVHVEASGVNLAGLPRKDHFGRVAGKAPTHTLVGDPMKFPGQAPDSPQALSGCHWEGEQVAFDTASPTSVPSPSPTLPHCSKPQGPHPPARKDSCGSCSPHTTFWGLSRGPLLAPPRLRQWIFLSKWAPKGCPCTTQGPGDSVPGDLSSDSGPGSGLNPTPPSAHRALFTETLGVRRGEMRETSFPPSPKTASLGSCWGCGGRACILYQE